SLERVSRHRRSITPARENDSRVFWLMLLFGALLTTGFLLGLRSQINAHQLNRAEEKLRDELDRYASQQKFLDLDQKRALSPRESERSVKEDGLIQSGLDEKNALAQLPIKSNLPLDPSKNSNSLPVMVAARGAKGAKGAKEDGKPVVVKPSFDKLPGGRAGKGLKAPESPKSMNKQDVK